MLPIPSLCHFVVTVFLALLPSHLVAQCHEVWYRGSGLPGVDGQVDASTIWDPDGPGLLQARLVVGGDFVQAGDVTASRVAIWDGERWSNLGVGLNGHVGALVSLPTGELLAGGSFTQTGEAQVLRVARWTGSEWVQVGLGFNDGQVEALCVLPNGNVVAGGTFTSSGFWSTNRVALFDGAGWNPMGAGFTTGVKALAAFPNGDVAAGGFFSTVQRWNGTSWITLGSNFNGSVESLMVHSDGSLFAGGIFSRAGTLTVHGIARWNGSAWGALASGLGDGYVYTLTELPGGAVVAGGGFTGPGIPNTSSIAVWNGTGWGALGSGFANAEIRTTAVSPQGDVLAGGYIVPGPGRNVARWNGSAWGPVGLGFDDSASALASTATGRLIAGGSFFSVHGQVVRCVTERTSSGWTSLGTGMASSIGYPNVQAVTLFPNGDVVAGGFFSMAGGTSAAGIARYSGGSWNALGSGVTGPSVSVYVSALLVHTNGDLYAGGKFSHAGGQQSNGVAKWDGSAWQPLGTGVDGVVNALAEASDGRVIVGGSFSTAGGVPANNIAAWNGTAWNSLGSGVQGVSNATAVRALAVLSQGNIVAGGEFFTAGGVSAANLARWNGVQWSAVATTMGGFSTPSVRALLTTTEGSLVVGGLFTTIDGTPFNSLARWNPNGGWSALGSGTYGAVVSLAGLPGGTIAAGGGFTQAGGMGTAFFAEWGCSPCYANCDESTNPPILTANDFMCFLNRFAGGESYANCDRSPIPPLLTANDFGCFMNAFALGCN